MSLSEGGRVSRGLASYQVVCPLWGAFALKESLLKETLSFILDKKQLILCYSLTNKFDWTKND